MDDFANPLPAHAFLFFCRTEKNQHLTTLTSLPPARNLSKSFLLPAFPLSSTARVNNQCLRRRRPMPFFPTLVSPLLSFLPQRKRGTAKLRDAYTAQIVGS